MKLTGRHKFLVAVGLLITIAAWLSWNLLLTESATPPAEPAAVDSGQ